MIITGHDSAKRDHRERTSGLALALQKDASIFGAHPVHPVHPVDAQRERVEREHQKRFKSLLATSNGEYARIVGQVLRAVEEDPKMMRHAKEAHYCEFVSHRYLQAKPNERGIYEKYLLHLFGKLPDFKKEGILSTYERTTPRSN